MSVTFLYAYGCSANEDIEGFNILALTVSEIRRRHSTSYMADRKKEIQSTFVLYRKINNFCSFSFFAEGPFRACCAFDFRSSKRDPVRYLFYSLNRLEMVQNHVLHTPANDLESR